MHARKKAPTLLSHHASPFTRRTHTTTLCGRRRRRIGKSRNTLTQHLEMYKDLQHETGGEKKLEGCNRNRMMKDRSRNSCGWRWENTGWNKAGHEPGRQKRDFLKAAVPRFLLWNPTMSTFQETRVILEVTLRTKRSLAASDQTYCGYKYINEHTFMNVCAHLPIWEQNIGHLVMIIGALFVVPI